MNENISQRIDLRETQVEKDLLETLSSEEKKEIIDALNKFREENKNTEKLWIMVLTSDELEELKNNIHQSDTLSEFIDQQIQETITTSEILDWTSIEKNLGWKENLEKFTQVSERILSNYLFNWNDSLLSHLWLNEDAKQNIVVWFNFFIFDFLSKNKENFDIEKNISYFTNNIWWLLEWNFSNLWDIFSLWDKSSEIINNLKSSFWALTWKLEIIKTELNSDIFTNGWENNEIIMNPNETVKFFNWVLDGSIINIQNYVIQKQTANPVIIENSSLDNLKSIWNTWWDLIPESVWSKLGGMSDIFNSIEDYKETIKLWITQSPKMLEVLAWLESIPLIGDILKFFADLLWIGSFENMFENSQFWEIQKELSELFKNKELFVHWLNISDDFLKIWNKNDLNLLTNLKSLSNGSDDYKKTLEWLLKKWSDFENFNNTLQEKKVISPTQVEWNLNYSSLSKSLELYTQFEAKKTENPKITLDEFIIEIQKEEAQKVAALHKFESIKQEESFEKTDTELKSTCEVNGQWYNILWNKHWEIQLQSENKKYFYFVDSIIWHGEKWWIQWSSNFTNNDFFKEHWAKVDIQAVKWIIPLLVSKWNINNKLEHSITTQEGKIDFKIKTTNVIDKRTENPWTWSNVDSWISKKSPEKESIQWEIFEWNMYKYKSMSLISPFNIDKEINLVDEDWKSVTYKLNYKNSLDWANEVINWDVTFDIKKEWWKYILKNSGLWIKIDLKDLFKQLHTWINQVDIQKDNFFWLEFQKVQK